ncbi:MAG: sensor histidine kinase, partial [Gammaproteobacteria bacterium]|nr:sensor histidine kinase [Gammaproteobacteria bacterium]
MITKLQKMLSVLRRKWESNSLSVQFALMGSAVLLAGMLIIGIWVADKIETIVSLNLSIDSALYMDSFIAPHIQDLATNDFLNKADEEKLDDLLKNTAIGNRVASFKIWKPGGLIAYSSRKSIIGMTFPTTKNLNLAWKGNIASEFDTLTDEEDAKERATGVPYLEIYSPVRQKSTGKIIAVAEFYVKANLFQQALFNAKFQSWMLVGFVTMIMLGLLFIIVHRGSRTIDFQKMALEARVDELSILRNRLKSASRKTTELNEHFLRQVGSDLHDGPAQLLGLVLLRLDALRGNYETETVSADSGQGDFKVVQDALNDALEEIRNISAGLVLPELEGLSLTEVLKKVVKTHERRTDSTIDLQLDNLPATANRSARICFYRFVQEGLNNAYHHAFGAECKVIANRSGEIIELKVSDNGSGFNITENKKDKSVRRLGLAGLRERIESLGGQFDIQSSSGRGTELTARFSIADLEIEDEE